MKIIALIRLILTIALIVFLGACVTSGSVVKVTTVNEDHEKALKEEERARLEEIKKDTVVKKIDENLNKVLQKTPIYSVSEYLLKYPEGSGHSTMDYRVGGYDVLSIVVYEEENLSREAVRVSGDGYISFPLINRVKVDGLTTSEIEKLISRKLAEGQYVLDAHVSVMVTGYKSKQYIVLGPVTKSGSYSLQAREHVLDAISGAGGIDTEKAGNKAMIIRTLDAKSEHESKVVINIDLRDLLKRGNQLSNLFLRDKDILIVSAVEFFYIIGQVNKPGSYPMSEKDITLVEAIGMAGGFTRIAARNKTHIIRVEDGVEKIIEVQVDAIIKAGKKIQDVRIEPEDVIVVPESFF